MPHQPPLREQARRGPALMGMLQTTRPEQLAAGPRGAQATPEEEEFEVKMTVKCLFIEFNGSPGPSRECTEPRGMTCLQYHLGCRGSRRKADVWKDADFEQGLAILCPYLE